MTPWNNSTTVLQADHHIIIMTKNIQITLYSMKKSILFLTFAVLCLFQAHAVPANPKPVTITQPDGSTLTVRLVGDEFYHFNTTSDGYTILKNESGFYVYAQKQGDQLVPSTQIAHNAANRSASEINFLSKVGKNLTDASAIDVSKAKRSARDASALQKTKPINYSKFKGLVILVNFNDRQFSMNDPASFYSKMINEHNFTEYTDDKGIQVNCTGSVRDFYYDNSNHVFDPSFDVYGPVTADYSCTYPQGTRNIQTVFLNALNKLNDAVDFSKYDTDGDGYIDMVYFLVAGYSAAFGGNSSNYLWPHKSQFSSYIPLKYDGKTLKTYACSCELYGVEGYPGVTVEGIGTMCHEFGHVLGLPDFYDTDYNNSGGESHHSGEWDIMAGGSSHNYSRTPAGYTIFERYALGFANPKVITQPGDYTLGALQTSNEGYIIKTDVNREYFILDNRQNMRWDQYVPGHGMIITRVDSTDMLVWLRNTINNNPSHQYFEIVRAGNGATGDNNTDPFPGDNGAWMINNTTVPALKTWAGHNNKFGLKNIQENDGVITFSVYNSSDTFVTSMEDFESMPTTTSIKQSNVQGKFAKWNFVNSFVTTGVTGHTSGQKASAIFSPGLLAMNSDINPGEVYLVSADIYNPESTDAKYKLWASTNGGTNWVAINNIPITVPGGKSLTAQWKVDYKQPVRFRINMTAGSKVKTNPTYIDNFNVYYNENSFDKGDVNKDNVVNVSDVTELINMILGTKPQDLTVGDIDGNRELNVSDVTALINIILGN